MTFLIILSMLMLVLLAGFSFLLKSLLKNKKEANPKNETDLGRKKVDSREYNSGNAHNHGGIFQQRNR